MSGKWRLIFILVVFVGVAGPVAALLLPRGNSAEPCEISEDLILLADARRQMQEYLSTEGITGEVKVREEGSFMLGAYPRSNVLWSIDLSDSKITPEDNWLGALALNAYCIRKGWVWIITGGVPSKITSFSQEQLAEMLHSQ